MLGAFGKHAFTYKRGHGPVGRPLRALSGKFYSTNEKKQHVLCFTCSNSSVKPIIRERTQGYGFFADSFVCSLLYSQLREHVNSAHMVVENYVVRTG